MAFLSSAAGENRRVSSGKPRIKEFSLEIFSGLDFVVHGVNFEKACLALLLSKRMLTTRIETDTDKSLGWISGLISNDASKHPPWEAEL